MYYLSLYMEFIKIKLLGVMEYRAAFIWGVLAQGSAYGAEFILIWITVNHFKSINGWKPYEVMLLFSLNLASYAIASFFLFEPCAKLSGKIKSGTFDEVLTKPLNNFLYLVCREFNSGYMCHLGLSIIVLVICNTKLHLITSVSKLLFLLLVILSGALIQGAGYLFTCVPAFWVVESNSLRQIVHNQFRSFIQYPISIYNKGVQILLTLIIPYAFINFYPAQYFLKKDDFLMFNPTFQYLSPFIGIILFAAGYKFWNLGIDHYKSTGS